MATGKHVTLLLFPINVPVCLTASQMEIRLVRQSMNRFNFELSPILQIITVNKIVHNPYYFHCYFQCERCMPLYNEKPFKIGDQINAYNCKMCQCYGHAASCAYDQSADPFPDDHNRGGGGRCVNCQHNTIGRLCDGCAPLYYREVGKSLYDVDVCSPCDCYSPGVMGNNLDCNKV